MATDCASEGSPQENAGSLPDNGDTYPEPLLVR
jgi:hypothetical protein